MYCNAMTSEYYSWFVELGYPQLDVVFYEDREWSIIEFENAPLVPSMTKWKVVFSGFRNVEFNKSFVKKMVEMIDLRKQEVWDRIERETEERKEHDEAIQAKRDDAVLQTAKELAKNDALMDRAAKIGPEAFSLDNLLKGMSPTQVRSVLGSRVQVFA
jgi:hypothetical protein